MPRTDSAKREAAWIACNLGARRMDLERAPSLRAVRLLQAMKKDEKLKHAFWLGQLGPKVKKRASRERDW